MQNKIVIATESEGRFWLYNLQRLVKELILIITSFSDILFLLSPDFPNNNIIKRAQFNVFCNVRNFTFLI